ESTDTFGRFLWLWPATGFLPHCRLASPLAAETPILVDHLLEHDGPAAVLINLQREPPPFFARFERLAEIIGTDEAGIASCRARLGGPREQLVGRLGMPRGRDPLPKVEELIRNRARAVATEIPELTEAVAEIAPISVVASLPAVASIPTSLDEVPELTDAVEE